jgi:hypothetical protein
VFQAGMVLFATFACISYHGAEKTTQASLNLLLVRDQHVHIIGLLVNAKTHHEPVLCLNLHVVPRLHLPIHNGIFFHSQDFGIMISLGVTIAPSLDLLLFFIILLAS